MSTGASSHSLGRYELIKELGRGPGGVVYMARDPQLDRIVAIKTVSVPPGLTEVERAVFERRFLEEARRAASLSHPGLVVAHDVGTQPASGLLFVVFEYVEGPTLAERLAQGPAYVWRDAARLLARVAEALQHAHAAGVVHRDLRPSNIVILASGEPKVMDFGVARPETARMTLSTIREAFGVPLYMSPEQAVGESVDARSDLFSLGAIAFRLLAGRDAFAAADPRAVLSRVVYDDPPPVSSLEPSLPSGMDDVIAHCLAKSRMDRYPDARSLAEDLEDLMSGRPPRHAARRALAGEAVPQPPAVAGGTWSGRRSGRFRVQDDRTALLRRSAVRGLAGAAALALVGVLELFRRWREVPTPETPASPRPTDPAHLTAPTPAPAIPAEPLVDTGLPSLNDPDPAASARLSLELAHPLRRGSWRVSIDDERLVEQTLSATTSRSVLGVKLRGGRVRHLLPVKPGRRRIQVDVFWDDNRRSKTIVGTFKPGATRRLSAHLGRIAKSLTLDWE